MSDIGLTSAIITYYILSRYFLEILRSHSKYGDKSLSVCAPSLWISFPDHLRFGEDLTSFKSDIPFLFLLALTSQNKIIVSLTRLN